MNKFYLRSFIIALLLIPFAGIAQKVYHKPTGTTFKCTDPGTNPGTAIPVCGTNVFTQTSVTQCDDLDISQNKCSDIFTSGHSFWYKFKCFQGGLLQFLLQPNGNDDYDWILFDMTGHSPADVYTDPTIVLSINGSFPTGVATGCAPAGTTDVECFSSNQPINKMPKLFVDHNYLLMVTNYTNSGLGYELTFGGTAGITDGSPALVDHLDVGCSAIKAVFNKEVKCNSISASGGEFTITPGIHPIANVTTTCLSNYATELTINLPASLAPGNYTLTINNSPSDGNTFLDVCDNAMPQGTTVNFTVLQPKSDFTFPPEGCTNPSINFTSTSDPLAGNTIVSYQWDFGDATTGTGATPIHTYTAPGDYVVKHWIVNSKGCNSDTTSHSIHINQQPTPFFTTAGPYCISKDITFTDASVPNVGAITNWDWDMGDGNVLHKTNGNPFTYQYTTQGLRNVSLTVTTTKGCIQTYTTQVTVNYSPVPAFISSPVCLPYGVAAFTNNSSIGDATPMSYSWDFGDPSSGINNTSTATAPSHYFSTTGPYNVILTATSSHSCVSAITIPVTNIYAQAHAPFSFGAPENCLGTATTFNSSATGSGNAIVSYNWDFGDAITGTGANPTHTYTTAGLKTVKHWVVTDKGCFSDTTTHTVYINKLPTPDFTFTPNNCQTRVSNFTDASVPNDGAVNTWQWNFDDATSPDNTSSLQNPSHIFNASGLYNVSLVVTTDKGCTNASVKKLVPVYVRPDAGYIPPSVCLNDTYAQFNDNSKIASGVIIGWLWDFGDPGSGPLNNATIPNPTHSYLATGPYNVRYIVTSDNGCKDTLNQGIFVNGSFPVAKCDLANTGNICSTDQVEIVNRSTVLPGNITKIEINWDDLGTPGVFEIDNAPTLNKSYKHTYSNFQTPLTKTFQIRFRAYSGQTCTNDFVQPVTVNATPNVLFNAIPDTCFLAVPFLLTEASEPNNFPGGAANGKYSGTGILNSNGLFSPAAAGIGTHTIAYTYTSLAGCTDTKTQTIRVLDTATAKFIYSTAPHCEGIPVTFTDRSTAPAGVTLTNTTWDFNDGTLPESHAAGTSFTHTFTKWDTYNVKMFNTSAYGCPSTITNQSITITPIPKTLFTFGETSVCIPNAKVSFINQSTIDDHTENAFTYFWDFGDPASGPLNHSVARTPLPHLYTGVGPYMVTLTVTSGDNCPSIFQKPVNFIHPQPKAFFTPDKPSSCFDETVTFKDATDPLDGTTKFWHWNMGDGITGVPSVPVVDYTFGNTGTFDVSLYIINSHGCNSDTLHRSFTVYPYPVVNAGPDRRVLEGAWVKMQPVVSGDDMSYLWTPNLYLNNDKILAPTAQYIKDDITYKLTVTGRGGCPKTDEVYIKVLKAPKIPNTFTPNNDGINDKWDIQYLKDYPDCRVQVFTRTGQKVFEHVGVYQAWDGTKNGKPLPLDTYYYIIEAGDGRDALTGYVTILK